MKHTLTIKPAIHPKNRNRLCDWLTNLGYNIHGSGQHPAESACNIVFESGVDPLDKVEDNANKEDNWAGRAKGMICETCIYFVVKTGSIGRCRRCAPTMKGWPVMYKTDWCGEHKIDEGKVG